MDNQLETRVRGEILRNPSVTPGKLFSWENLLLLGTIACLALSLLVYQYIKASRILISYVGFPVSIILFCILAKRHHLLKNRDIWLLLIGLAWILVSSALNFGRAGIQDLLPPAATMFFVALLCYPLAHVITKERRVKTFRLLAWLWAIPVVCTTIIAIVLALSGTVLYRAADNAPLGLVEHRLWLICDPNMYGMLCCMALSLVLYLLLGNRRPAIRALLVFMALCLFVAISLTDCRSAMTALLIVAFFFAALVVWQLLRKKKNALRLLLGCLAGIAFCGVLLLGYRGVSSGFNALLSLSEKAQDNASEASASTPRDNVQALSLPVKDAHNAAEAVIVSVQGDTAPSAVSRRGKTQSPASASTRGFDDTNTLQQRLGIWAYAIGRIPEEPDVLLRGATPALSLKLFLDPDARYNHLHNAYLSVLLSYGIPGFLIMAAFFIFLAVCLWRLLFSPRADLPLELRLLPGIVLAILAINFVESMLFTLNFISELDVWLAIISGFAVVFSRDYRKDGKAALAADA